MTSCSGVLGCIGIMEKKMETTTVDWGNTGIMEKKMETTIGLRVAFRV